MLARELQSLRARGQAADRGELPVPPARRRAAAAHRERFCALELH